MENLKRKVESLVAAEMGGASVELEVVPLSEKLSGFVVWKGFYGKPHRDRQRELWTILRQHLTREEQLMLSAVLTLTPAEEKTYSEESVRL
jgi:hypothetical protein